MRLKRILLAPAVSLLFLAAAPAHSAPKKKPAKPAVKAEKAIPDGSGTAAGAPEPAAGTAPDAAPVSEETPAEAPPQKKERFPGPPLPDVDTKIYNLDACLRIADQISPEIMINRMKVVESEAQLAQAKAAAFLPEFTGKLLIGPAPGQVVNPVPDLTAIAKLDQTGSCKLTSPADPSCPTLKVESPKALQKLGPFVRFEFQFAQPIYTWGKLDAAQTLARSGIRNSKLELVEKRSEIRKRIRELYWGYEAASAPCTSWA